MYYKLYIFKFIKSFYSLFCFLCSINTPFLIFIKNIYVK